MIKIIYNSDSYNNYTDSDIIEQLRENDIKLDDITEQMILNEQFMSQIDFEDEEGNLNLELPHKIICIANLGLWNGKHTGYKILGYNLKEILYQAQGDYYKVYYDGYNIKATDIHHDGTNHYTFRMIKPNMNIELLLTKLYNGTAQATDINNYTTSLRKYAKEIYGW